jgi:hypothetical protein
MSGGSYSLGGVKAKRAGKYSLIESVEILTYVDVFSS